MGPKVVVEPPTIHVIEPLPSAFLTGDKITFKGKATAYIKVEKVEVFIAQNKDIGQPLVNWTDKGIVMTGGLKEKEFTYVLDTTQYKKDGYVKIYFRVFDSAAQGDPKKSHFIHTAGIHCQEQAFRNYIGKPGSRRDYRDRSRGSADS